MIATLAEVLGPALRDGYAVPGLVCLGWEDARAYVRAAEAERALPVFQTVARAVEIIRRDFAKPLLIGDLAAACGESVRQLQRRFRDAFGSTPQEFLIKTRILEAARLLEGTTLSVAEISARCGFVDASSFTQHFRRRTGVTPKGYRAGK